MSSWSTSQEELRSLMSNGWSWRTYTVTGDSTKPSGLVWRGEWRSDASYSYGDVVQYNGAAYIVGVNGSPISSDTPPDADPYNWGLVDAASDISVTF